jgi:hypothetical protein
LALKRSRTRLPRTRTCLVLELREPYVEAAIAWAAHLIKMDSGLTGEAVALEARYDRIMRKVRESLFTRSLSDASQVLPRDSVLLDYPVRSSIRRGRYGSW